MEWIVVAPARLDAFMAEQYADCSRAKLQKHIKAGAVTVNRSVQKKTSHQLKEGDTVQLSIDITDLSTTAARETNILPHDLSITVLYEDEVCMVVDKPAGYSVHPGDGMTADEKTILHGIAFLYQERSIPFFVGSILVHRLDKDTTGCLLVAKTEQAHVALQKQFKDRTVQKTYMALVSGVPNPASALIDSPIGRNLTDRKRMSVVKTSVSRESQTTYRTVGSQNGASLLECDLHTGRTHQVRVHLHSIDHCILGDRKYSSAESENLSKAFSIQSLCLHAWRLSFTSPADNKKHSIESPLPKLFSAALSKIGL